MSLQTLLQQLRELSTEDEPPSILSSATPAAGTSPEATAAAEARPSAATPEAPTQSASGKGGGGAGISRSSVLMVGGLLLVIGGALFYAFYWRGRARRRNAEASEGEEEGVVVGRPAAGSAKVPQALLRRAAKRVHFADEEDEEGPLRYGAEGVPATAPPDFDDVPQVRIDQAHTLGPEE
jgi:hypothetical protein